MNLASALLLSISANLDTFVVAVSYGLKKVKLSFSSILLIAFITSIGTFLSMYLGLVLSSFVSISLANNIGSIMLLGMGIWFVRDSFKSNSCYCAKECTCEHCSIYCNVLSDPIKADKDNSGTIDFRECITLSVALSLNNVGLGIAASIAGMNIYLNTTLTFVVTLFGFLVGGYIGKRYLYNFLGKHAATLSGILIICIGFFQLFK